MEEKNRWYRVKEIYERTGLPRKLLFEYKELVPPVATEYAGHYKLYDEEGLMKLRLIAALRKIGFEKPDIIAWFHAAGPEEEVRLLKEVRSRVEKKKQDLDTCLADLDRLLSMADDRTLTKGTLQKILIQIGT